MVSRGPGRNGSHWRRIQAELITAGEQTNTPCYLCGKPINYQLTRAYPQHSMAGTAHHIIGLAQGGDPIDLQNLAPAHRSCNTRESNRLRALAKRARRASVRTSRRW